MRRGSWETIVAATGAIQHSGLIAALGHTSVQAQSVQATGSSVFAAGLRQDGNLATGAAQPGNLSVAASQTLSTQGQHLAAGSASLQAASIDASNSRASAASLSLTATSGDIVTRNAQLVSTGLLSLNATAQPGQALRNEGGTLLGGQVALRAADLFNTGGQIIQSGTADTVVALTGRFDNRGGRFTSNGQQVQISATLLENGVDNGIGTNNQQGRIEHAGTGTLALTAAQLNGAAGLVASNGTLQLKATQAVLDRATTVATRLDIDTQTLSHRGGTLVQTGTQATAIRATQQLDNTGGSISSNGHTTLTVGHLLNQGGRVQAAGGEANPGASLTVNASGTVDNSQQGLLAAAGTLQVTGATLLNQRGQVMGKQVQVDVAQALDNRQGLIAATQNVNIAASSIDNTAGTLAAVQGHLAANARSGALANAGGRIEAAQDLSLASNALANNLGQVIGRNVSIDTRSHAVDNTQGQIAARGTLNVQSGQFTNDAGLVQAGAAMTLNTHGQALVNTRTHVSGDLANPALGILGRSSATLQTGAFNNQGGFVGAAQALAVSAAGIDNRNGVLSSATTLSLQASDLHNQGGQVQANGNVTAALAGTLDNRGGLMRSDSLLDLQAAQVLNSNTQGQNQGLEGFDLRVRTASLDNQAGALRADQDMTLELGSSLNNRQGLLSAGRTLAVRDAVLAGTNLFAASSAPSLAVNNEAGLMVAGSALNLQTASLAGAGRLLSHGDLSLSLQGDHTQVGELHAERNASVSTTGTLTNTAVMRADGNMQVTAGHINNQASGEISGAHTEVVASGTLNNRGLIDGGTTYVSAGTLNNLGTGRIYGDHLAIQAGTLNNNVEGGAAAVIAARGRLDLGVGTLENVEHSLIFSAGDMSIGGSLDGNRRATGSATAVNNRSATIEALGDLDLTAGSIGNYNLHYNPNDQVRVQVGQTYYDNWDVYSDVVRARTTYVVTVTEPRVVNADPGKILSGGTMHLSGGTLINDKSQILAGGAMTINTSTPAQNIGDEGKGLRVWWIVGSFTQYKRDPSTGEWVVDYRNSYDEALQAEVMSLGSSDIAEYMSHSGSGTQVSGRNGSNVDKSPVATGNTTATQRPGTVTEVRATVTKPDSSSHAAVQAAVGGQATTQARQASGPQAAGGAGSVNGRTTTAAAAGSAATGGQAASGPTRHQRCQHSPRPRRHHGHRRQRRHPRPSRQRPARHQRCPHGARPRRHRSQRRPRRHPRPGSSRRARHRQHRHRHRPERRPSQRKHHGPSSRPVRRPPVPLAA